MLSLSGALVNLSNSSGVWNTTHTEDCVKCAVRRPQPAMADLLGVLLEKLEPQGRKWDGMGRR
jgi:hypothetical protein